LTWCGLVFVTPRFFFVATTDAACGGVCGGDRSVKRAMMETAPSQTHVSHKYHGTATRRLLSGMTRGVAATADSAVAGVGGEEEEGGAVVVVVVVVSTTRC